MSFGSALWKSRVTLALFVSVVFCLVTGCPTSNSGPPPVGGSLPSVNGTRPEGGARAPIVGQGTGQPIVSSTRMRGERGGKVFGLKPGNSSAEILVDERFATVSVFFNLIDKPKFSAIEFVVKTGEGEVETFTLKDADSCWEIKDEKLIAHMKRGLAGKVLLSAKLKEGASLSSAPLVPQAEGEFVPEPESKPVATSEPQVCISEGYIVLD